MARNRYININPVMRDGEQYYRARLFLPFDVELGIKPRPIDFYSKTKEGADRKRAAYKPNDKKLDKHTGFVDLVRVVYIPAVRKRIDDKEISYGYGSYSISLLQRFLITPDEKDAPNVFAAAIRRVRLGLLTPTMTIEYFAALKADHVAAEATHRIKQQIAGALRLVKDRLAYPLVTFFEDVKLPTIITNMDRAMYDHEQVFAICRGSHFLIEDRALIGFLFMVQCRPSEMFALQWDDINLQNGIVSINKATRLTEKNKYEVTAGSKVQRKGEISDDAGIRRVKMPALLTTLLRDLQKYRKDMGNTSPWVFITASGLPLQPGIRIRRRWAAIVKRTGLPSGAGAPTFYSLKHIGNSWALYKGVSGEAQAKKMGQTSSHMATRNYRTILTPEKQRQADVFDTHLPSNSPDSQP
jgi:integrase